MKETSKIVDDKTKQVRAESKDSTVKVASEGASSSKKTSSTIVESKEKKIEHHMPKFVKDDVDPEMVDDEEDVI